MQTGAINNVAPGTVLCAESKEGSAHPVSLLAEIERTQLFVAGVSFLFHGRMPLACIPINQAFLTIWRHGA